MCNPGEYTAEGGFKLTPSQRVFHMKLDWPTYGKLINAGMAYLNWSATVNVYKTSKNWDYPILSGSFWGSFSNSNAHRNVGNWNYPNADWVLPSASARRTWISMYTKMYTGGYGADNNVSGKYDIKTPYNKFKGFNANACNVEFDAGVSLTEPGDGFYGSDGKVWVKSFNFWFSKS